MIFSASLLIIVLVGVIVGITTALFGFGGGFVTVPIIAIVDAHLGGDALAVATATSALVMLVNAIVATVATDREALATLRGRGSLITLLAFGGALGAALGRFSPDWLLRWGFVTYVLITIIDLVARPGFITPKQADQPEQQPATNDRRALLPSWLGAPIGTIAALLGVGGSVMTVPLMRRSGAPMSLATTLANPLTLAIVAPALLVSLLIAPGHVAAPGLVGSVDLVAGLALLVGAVPVIVYLRRRAPRISDTVHAWSYIGLLAFSASAVALTSLTW